MHFGVCVEQKYNPEIVVSTQSIQNTKLSVKSSELRPPLPHSQASVAPPLWVLRGHTRKGEGVGGFGLLTRNSGALYTMIASPYVNY
jgi:hypothetical protein